MVDDILTKIKNGEKLSSEEVRNNTEGIVPFGEGTNE